MTIRTAVSQLEPRVRASLSTCSRWAVSSRPRARLTAGSENQDSREAVGASCRQAGQLGRSSFPSGNMKNKKRRKMLLFFSRRGWGGVGYFLRIKNNAQQKEGLPFPFPRQGRRTPTPRTHLCPGLRQQVQHGLLQPLLRKGAEAGEEVPAVLLRLLLGILPHRFIGDLRGGEDRAHGCRCFLDH